MTSLRLSRLIRRDPDRPTLKQRAAALRATAAKVMRRKVVGATPDPILAAIADHRAKWDVAEAVKEGSPGDAAAQDAYHSAFARLCATRPTTISGYHALADHLAWRLGKEGYAIGSGATIVETAADLLLVGVGALDAAEHVPARRVALDVHAIVSSEAAEPAASPDYAGLPDPAIVTAGFDVEALSLHKMLMLHEAAQLLCGVGEAVLCQPRCDTGRGEHAGERNEIGHFVEWLVEICRSVIGRARAEAEQRTPADWIEAGFRLGTLAEAVVSNGDPAQMRAFARDLQAEAGRLARG